MQAEKHYARIIAGRVAALPWQPSKFPTPPPMYNNTQLYIVDGEAVTLALLCN